MTNRSIRTTGQGTRRQEKKGAVGTMAQVGQETRNKKKGPLEPWHKWTRRQRKTMKPAEELAQLGTTEQVDYQIRLYRDREYNYVGK